MPSSPTTSLRLELQGQFENDTTWGIKADALFQQMEDAICGYTAVTHSDAASYTLTALNYTADEARRAFVSVGGTLTAQRNVVCPTAPKHYWVRNNTTGGFSIIFKTSGGAGITIPSGKTRGVYCDGTNVIDAFNDLPTGTTVNNDTLVSLTAAQTLTNKILDNTNALAIKDTNLAIQDDGDATKVIKFQVSGITTGTIRTWTWPDASDTVVGLAAAQVLLNKSLSDATTFIVDEGDATKKLTFQVSDIATATTRTWTWPDANDTVVGLAATQALTNKTLGNTNTVTLKDTLFTIQDDGDATKQAKFQASGITTGTTRTFTLPNVDGTLLHTTGDGSTLTGIKKQGKETIWIPAGAMTPSTTNGAIPTTTESATNKVMLKTLDFADGATVLHAQFGLWMPKSWNTGTITYAVAWTANSTSTNSVVWQLKAVALSNDETIDAAFGTAITITDANTSTALQVHLTGDSGAVTIAGSPAALDYVVLDISRDPTNGSDTLAATAKLVGIKVFITSNASDDT